MVECRFIKENLSFDATSSSSKGVYRREAEDSSPNHLTGEIRW